MESQPRRVFGASAARLKIALEGIDCLAHRNRSLTGVRCRTAARDPASHCLGLPIGQHGPAVGFLVVVSPGKALQPLLARAALPGGADDAPGAARLVAPIGEANAVTDASGVRLFAKFQSQPIGAIFEISGSDVACHGVGLLLFVWCPNVPKMGWKAG